jgi:hypothetical protein
MFTAANFSRHYKADVAGRRDDVVERENMGSL